jgi:hypothetical protein
MKKIVAIVLAYIALEFGAISGAHAQTVDTAATSTNTNASSSGALNQGVSQQNNFYSPSETKFSGSYTIKEAPPVQAAAGYGSFSQQNCMVSGSAGISLVGVGATGQAPIDGKHCDWRLDQAALGQTAMTLHNFVAANPTIDAGLKTRMELKAAAMLRAAGDMSCLSSDRQREVMEKEGLCGAVEEVSSVDHREGQPRNYGIDYAKLDGGRALGN